MRKIKFYNGEYYHIYNRGVDKQNIFKDKNDYLRFLDSMNFYSKIKTGSLEGDPVLRVEIICYCLNPNHFHFLLKQLIDKGIEDFMHRLGVSHAMYFNKKYNRSGSLFQGRYKSIRIKNNSGLLWLSAYINGNPEIHDIVRAKDYPWSSYLECLKKISSQRGDKSIILDQFKNQNEYQEFTNLVIEEARLNKKIHHS